MSRESKREIEVCFSSEWLRVYGPLGPVATTDECDSWSASIFELLRELGYQPHNPRGLRITCNGWHGAGNKFARHAAGLGTFEDLSDDEWNTLVDASTNITREIMEGEKRCS